MSSHLVRLCRQRGVLPAAAAHWEVVEPAPAHGVGRQVPEDVVLFVVHDEEEEGQEEGGHPNVPAVVVALAGPHAAVAHLESWEIPPSD